MWSAGVTPIAAIYNRQVFADGGNRDAAEDVERIAGDCEKIKARGVSRIAVGNQTPWVTQLIPYAIAPSTAFKTDPNLAQDMLAGRKTFSDSGWRTVFERYLELERRGLTSTRARTAPRSSSSRRWSAREGGDGRPGRDVAGLPQGRGEARPTSAASRSRPPTARAISDPGGRLGRHGRQRAEPAPGRGQASSSRSSRRPENMAALLQDQPLDPARRATRRARLDGIVEPFAAVRRRGADRALHGPAVAEREGPAAHFAGVAGPVRRPDDVDGLLEEARRGVPAER